MKITVIILLSTFLQVHGSIYGQSISIEARNINLKEVFRQLRKQTGFGFLYQEEDLKGSRNVNLDFKDAPLKKVLDQCFIDQPLTYTIEKKIVIVKREKETVSTPTDNILISGKVTDIRGEPLPGVSIRIKGEGTIAISDKDGNYKIAVPTQQAILIFTYIGFALQEAQVLNRTVINITLKEKKSDLDEVIVIGYGETQKRDLTGSVGSVKMADLERAPVKSFEEALAGRVAGVQVTSTDGQPGSLTNIVIRGNNSLTQDNSPLYIIDGFPIENPDNNIINPSEIESIEVLKDASSTAIYGARGANGVILITTKRGKIGSPVITYEGYYGFQNNLNKQDLMNPYEFVKFQNELDPSIGSLYFVNGKTSAEDYRDVTGIDWQDQLFRTASIQNHTLSIRGGNADTRYSISGSYLGQDGTIIKSGYTRAQGRIILDQTINKRLKVGVNANFSRLKSFGTPTATDRNYSLLYNAWGYRPINGSDDLEELLDSKEDLEVATSGDYRFNPILTANNEVRDRTTNALQANGYGEYLFTKDLKLRISAGLSLSQLRYDVFDNSKTRSANPNGPLGQNGVNGSVNYTQRSNYVNENTLTYNKTINRKHKISLLAGATIQGTQSFIYGAGAILVPNENLELSGLDEGTPYSINSVRTKNTLASFLGRVNYSYKSKYLLTASLRSDGSSKFPKNNKWGLFPSGAIAWRLGEERFIKALSFVSDAKFRVSYGMTGNNRVGDFDYYSALTLPITASYSPDNTVVQGSIPSSLGNSNLKWETTSETDLGLDLGFFNQRITLSVDLYKKKTDDLLLNAQLPPTSGYSSAFKNVGSVQNKGLEILFNSVNIDNKRFSWSTGLNISFNRNKVLSLTQGQNELLTNINWDVNFYSIPLYVARINGPIAQFYGLIWDGNYQFSDFNETSPGVYVLKDEIPNNGNVRGTIKPGDIKYRDINNDGVVDANDRTIIGNPNPKFIGGFTNDFRYKAFDLNVFMQWSYGNQIMNANRIIFEGSQARKNLNQFTSYENRWTPENQNNIYFRAGGYGPTAYSSRTIEDGSYLRLKTVSLGYNLPAAFARKMNFKSLRVYLSAQNLITWSRSSSNSDPEVSTFSTALSPGFDFSAYPRARTIVFGAKLIL